MSKRATSPRTAATAPTPRTREPKQARGHRTRASILTAAMACFEERGYDETTTAQIAREAGIAVGTIYTYFENKRAILLEIIATTMAEMGTTVIEHLDPGRWQGADPRRLTETLIDQIFHTQRLRPGMQRIVWERYFKDAAVREAIEAIWARTREAIRKLLRAVGDEGGLRGIDLDSATHVIHNAVHWNAMRAVAAGDPAQIDAYATAMAEMISRYVFVEPKP